MENLGIWRNDALNVKFKPISATEIREFGLSFDNIKHVKNIEELKENPPNIVIAEAIKTARFIQNHFKKQELTKKVKYVMGLGVYQQLRIEPNTQKRLLKPSIIKFKNLYRPYRGQNLDGKTVLVFRTGGIGDLLFIQPNLIYLKEKYPTCKIYFACGPQYQPMVKNWSCVDTLLDLPFSLKYLQEADYHMLFEGVIERCKEAEYTNAYNLFSKWLGLDLPDELLTPKQTPIDSILKECKDILEYNKVNNFIVMQLRASSPVRTPSHNFWLKIINGLTDLGVNVVLTDNPRQTEKIDQFISLCKNKEKVFNFCKYSKDISYTIALIALSNGVIGTDSATNHIAASLDKKCFGIFGPFPAEIRLKTYKKADWVNAKIMCSPCYIHSHKPCPKADIDGYSVCYNSLVDSDEKTVNLLNKIKGFFDND